MNLRYRLLLATFLVVVLANLSLAQWEQLNGIPSVWFESASSSGGTIYIDGLMNDGFLFSTDDGYTWTVENGLPGTAASIASNTIGGQVLIIAATDKGLFKTTDFGMHWTELTSPAPVGDVRALVVSNGTPLHPQGVCLAATDSEGVFLSSDQGSNWHASNDGLTTLNLTAAVETDSSLFVGTNGGGIFRSSDRGATWLAANQGLNDTVVSTFAVKGGEVVVATTNGVYRSSNEGAHWILEDSASCPTGVTSLALVQPPGAGEQAVVLANTVAGVYRLASEDTSWSYVFPATYGWLAHDLVAVDSTAYVVTVHVIYRSTDLGKTWVMVVQPLNGNLLTAGMPDSSGHADLYCAQDSSIFKSTDQGMTWDKIFTTPMREPLGRLTASVDAYGHGPDRIMAATSPTQFGTLYRSDDGGSTWKSILQKEGAWCLATAERDSVFFVSVQLGPYPDIPHDTVSGVYRSLDSGAHWTKMNTVGLTDSGVTSLATFRGNSGENVLFAGTSEHLFRSTNDGESWTESTPSPRSTFARMFSMLNGYIYQATSGSYLTSYDSSGNMIRGFDSSAVFRSSDDGLTWQDVTGDMPRQFLRGFAATTVAQYPSRVYLAVCTDSTVFSSIEGGVNWSWAGAGLPVFPSGRGGPLAVDGQNLYLGLSGIWRRPLGDLPFTSVSASRESEPAGFALYQNYPNPFNPTTVVSGQLTADSWVRLEVFDILGRKVATIADEKAPAGRFSYTFDARGLASGVYFYKLTAGNYVSTKSMILVK